MQKEVKTKHFCVHLPKTLEATRAAVAVQLSTCIQKTSTVMTLIKTVITKPRLMNSGCLQVVSSNVSAYSEQARVAKRQSRSSVKLCAAVALQALLRTTPTEQHPCSHQWDRAFHAPGYLSKGRRNSQDEGTTV